MLQTRVLQVIAFLDLFAVGMLMPQLAAHARKLGFTHLLIGTVGAAYSGLQLISGPITGSLSDINGRKPILLLTIVLSGLAYVLLGITSSIVVFIALRSVLGVTKKTQLVAKALVPDYEKDVDKQSVVYGRLSTMAGVGMSIGPIVGGHIVEAYPENGFMLITTIMGVIFAVMAGLAKTLPKDEIEKARKKKSKENKTVTPVLTSVTNNLKQSFEEFYKVDWVIYWEVFLIKLLIALAMGTYFTNYAIFLKTKHDVSPKYLGYIISVQGGIGSFCTYFIGYINKFYKDDHDFTMRNYHVFIVLAGSLLGVALAPNIFLYIICLVPLAICSSVGRVVSLEMIMSKSDATHRGTVLGVSSSIRSLSGVISPMIVGLISEYIGVLYVIYVSIFFASIGVVFSYPYSKRNTSRRKTD